MHAKTRRLAVAAAVVAIVACDSLPTTPPPGGGPTGGGTSGKDTTPPALTFTGPPADTTYFPGDTIILRANVSDNGTLKEFHAAGYKVTGRADIGTLSYSVRYSEVTKAISGSSATVVQGLVPVVPLDTTADSLVIRMWAVDSAGNADTVQRVVRIVSAARTPTVSITTPKDTFIVGDTINVSAVLADRYKLTSFSLVGLTITGNPANGTAKEVVRYSQVDVPVTGKSASFVRGLIAQLPYDTMPGPMTLRAWVTDSLGWADTVEKQVYITKGPKSPGLTILTPTSNQSVNVGDTLTVQGYATGRLYALKEFHAVGLTIKGSAALGTLTEKVRYPEVVKTLSRTDTTILRGLVPGVPMDSSVDSMVVRMWVVDSAGRADTVQRTVRIISGPTVHIFEPRPADTASFAPGNLVSFGVAAAQPAGLDSVSITLSEPTIGWTASFSHKVTSTPNSVDTIRYSAAIPSNAPDKDVIRVIARARDQLGQVRLDSMHLVVCKTCLPVPPVVTQTVTARLEYTDIVPVTARSNVGVKYIGIIVSDSVDTPNSFRHDSIAVAKISGVYPSIASVRVPLFPDGTSLTAGWSDSLRLAQQGKHLHIRSFAIDSTGALSYYAPAATVPPTDSTLASYDTTVVAYGRTYPLPRNGTVGDIAVDTIRGQAFLSNTSYNLVEVWNDTTKTFASNAVPVGSRPWGLFVSNHSDTLLVANSGATTISRVYIGKTTTGSTGIHESLKDRILTRNTFVYKVTLTFGQTKNSIGVTGPFGFSDRPQYIAQSAAGRLFFSTQPTPTAPDGTIRWLDPKYNAADARLISTYGTLVDESSTTHIWGVLNADSAFALAMPAGVSDSVILCDHPTNSTLASKCGTGATPETARAALNAIFIGLGQDTSDIEVVARLDVTSLGLTDTTYAAASGDRNWVAFGEGHTPDRAARVIMANDPDSTKGWPPFFSPLVTTTDLTENASEVVNGIALNTSGPGCTSIQCYLVAAHGSQSYVAYVDDPYHLRLGGFYDSFDQGAGIAFHPEAADPPSTSQDKRIAFAASTSGSIEIFDIAYFNNRGTLPTKFGLYGPLRATNAMTQAERNKGIVMKLYTLTPKGLLVIDLQAKDIQAGVP